MNVNLVYLYVVAPSSPDAPPPSFYEEYAVRFAWTYRRIDHGFPHRLLVVGCGAPVDVLGHQIFDPLNATYATYTGAGWDLGAYQAVAHNYDCDLQVNVATPVKLITPGWLNHLVQARLDHGDGLFGPQASCQYRPHIRTSCYAVNPRHLRDYPNLIDSRQKAVYFECGGGDHADWCFSNWMASRGPVLLVAADGNCYKREDWRKPPNVFRRGDQSNVLTWDRHNTIYHDSVPAEKARLEREADGLP